MLQLTILCCKYTVFLRVDNTVDVSNTMVYTEKYVKKAGLKLNVLAHKKKRGRRRKFLEVIDMFITLIVVMVPQV